MSDAATTNTKPSSACEIDNEEKIAALKERLSQDHKAHVVNGTNGNGNHVEKLAEMNASENKSKVKMTNGVNTSEKDNYNSLKHTEMSSSASSVSQLHTNGSSCKKEVSNIDTKNMGAGGKLSLPAGMSVTSLGKKIGNFPRERFTEPKFLLSLISIGFLYLTKLLFALRTKF